MGSTPLNKAAQYDNSEGVKFLLNCGAEIDVGDNEGDSALLNAIHLKNNKVVQILLENGANVAMQNQAGETALHRTALYGTCETVEVLRNADLRNVDPNVTNQQGKTALELARQRKFRPDGFSDLFEVLIFEIYNRRDYFAKPMEELKAHRSGNNAYYTEDDDLDEQFFDALEERQQ